MVDDKARKELISSFNKEFPDSQIESMDESVLAQVPGWISTGNYALNWCISKSLFKGVPLGRITLLSGSAGAGKSLIALSMMRQSDIDLIIYWDSEGGGVSVDFANFLGINPKKVLYSPIETIEDLKKKMAWLVDIVEKNKMTKKILLVVDSISMLSTDKELDPNAGCYTPDTLIPIFNDKLDVKRIDEIQVGDRVMSHLGTWDKVEKIWSFTSEEKPELIEIETEEWGTVRLTPQHRLLVKRDNTLQWIQAGDLTLSDELQKISEEII